MAGDGLYEELPLPEVILRTPRDEDPLLPSQSAARYNDERLPYGSDDEHDRGSLLLTASVTLVVGMGACLLLTVLLVGFLHGRLPDSGIGRFDGGLVRSRATDLSAAFCLEQPLGDVQRRTGTSSHLPPNPSSVYVVFRTGSPWQILASWGDQVELALDAGGALEYQELDPATGEPVVLRALGDHNLADQNWHAVVVVRSDSGRGSLFVDGFPVGEAQVPGLSPSAGLGDVKFQGNLASLRIFGRELDVAEVGQLRDAPCSFTSRTSTSTTVARTSDTATSTTASSTSSVTTTVGRVGLIGETVTATTTFTSTTATSSGTTTSTSTKSTTSVTRTSTATSSQTTTTRSTSSTHTTFIVGMPSPTFSSPGERGGDGNLRFEGAVLPPGGRGFSIMISFIPGPYGSQQELLSWGTVDGSAGCVSLYIDPDGIVTYGELAAGDDTWGSLSAERPISAGERHTVAVVRSAGGIMYLYVDGALVGEGMFEYNRPSDGLPEAAVAAQTCMAAAPYDFSFQGVIVGMELFDQCLTAREVRGTSLDDQRLLL